MTTTHETVTSIATTATYGGSGAAVLFGLTANEFAAIAGAVVAIVGLIVSWVFKMLERKDRIAHYKKMEMTHDSH
jgi:ABC-type proline/glycine betaine transport system permease subunit